MKRKSGGDVSLSDAWDEQAKAWAAWARKPGFDSYWRFHRDAFLRILPDPGVLTLDIGCGEGRLARDLAARGHSVIAVDVSPQMVRLAHEAAPGMDVRVADAAHLPFPDASADLAIAFMSYQDVDDMPAAMREARRVLTPDGRFCMAIVHPINSAGQFASTGDDADFILEGSYFETRRYVDEVEREGLRMTFHSMHAPLETYSRALENAGLVIEAIREVTMTPEAVGEHRERERWLRVPLFLHLRARPA
jgi:SAM-dependent methyltransferase